ncbi:hypothetical protein F4810DRAFT_680845 [Camillea tinctor]|nr:hypothetical protein F4810DRAFT_680845 [Camillea tinctor]
MHWERGGAFFITSFGFFFASCSFLAARSKLKLWKLVYYFHSCAGLTHHMLVGTFIRTHTAHIVIVI